MKSYFAFSDRIAEWMNFLSFASIELPVKRSRLGSDCTEGTEMR